MQIVNLKDNDYIKKFTFSGGERHIQIGENILKGIVPGKEVHLLTTIESSDDLMDLILVCDILRNNGATCISLDLPYIPYARQDRYTTRGSPFSLKCFADIINSLGFTTVHTICPHSYVSYGLIKNLEDSSSIYFHLAMDKLYDIIGDTKSLLIVAPDKGAEKRTREYAKSLGMEEIGTCTKIRNPENGRLEFAGFSENIRGRNILVLDDICDGGATFINLAENLKDVAKEMHLFVFHGIFSKGLTELKKYYKTIGTTHSFSSKYYDLMELDYEV